MSMVTRLHSHAWMPIGGLALLAFVLAPPAPAAGQGGAVATIRLVPQHAAGPADTTTALPAPLAQVDLGETFVVEVWAQTVNSNGLSSVSTTVRFDPAVARVTGVIHTTLFSELQSANVDNVAGLVAALSGSHLSPCVDQVGVAPAWARVALLEMRAAGSGSLAVESADTGLLTLGTAVCGVGDLLPSQVAYGTATLTVVGPPIPTVSQWGLTILALLLLSAGTLAVAKRARRSDVAGYEPVVKVA